MRSEEPIWTCLRCRRHFSASELGKPTNQSLEEIGAAHPPDCCPRCGAGVVPGPVSPSELERLHLNVHGGTIALLAALDERRIALHGWSRSAADPALQSLLGRHSRLLTVGSRYSSVIVDEPDETSPAWRLRVLTLVVWHGAGARPRVETTHDASFAARLRELAFTCGDVAVDVEGDRVRHRAVWEARAASADDVATLIQETLDIDTTADGDDVQFWHEFGDIDSMQELANALKTLGPASVTPWGLTLFGPNGRVVALIREEGHGTFHVHFVLPSGFGPRAARNRATSALASFLASEAAEWAEHGFTNPRSRGEVAIDHEGERRWTAMVAVSFAMGPEVQQRLTWAMERAIVSFPTNAPTCSRSIRLWSET